MGVDPKIPPVSLTDADFGDKVAREPNDRAKASEMEHAIRAHIREHADQDPVAYRKLSERLRDLLTQLGEHWDELTAALQGLVDDIRAGHVADDDRLPDLPEQYGPFLRLVVDAAAGDRAITPAEQTKLVDPTVDVVDTVVAELTPNFWKPNRQPAQDALGSRNLRAANALAPVADAADRGAGRQADGAGARQSQSPHQSMSSLVVNDLRFEVRRGSARRSLEITVDRTGELILAAPPTVEDAKLRDFVLRRRMLIYKQQARQDALGHEVPRKNFTDGEGFLYLGRSYRLRLVNEADAAVKLVEGRFVMPAALARDGREHLIRWYRERAQPWLTGKVEDYAARMEVAPAGVKVQDLGYRWG